jgi:enolase
MFIKEVRPRIIKNSRGEKSIEIELRTYKGKFRASAPSGKSRGKHEINEYHLRGGINFSFKMLVAFCRKLKHKNFIIKNLGDLKLIVKEIKKFEKQHGGFGGNVTYAFEAVFLKAASRDMGKELWKFIFDSLDYNESQGKKNKVNIPMPVGNCIGGGKHSREIKGKKPDFQEFLLIPNTKTFSQAITKNIRAYEYAKKLLKTRKINDENAWMTDKTNEEILFILKKIKSKFGVRIGIDAAASSFYKNGYYNYKNKKLIRDKIDQADYIERLIEKFGLFYIEDPINEEDFGGFVSIRNTLKRKKKGKKNVLIVGDDLTVTSLRRVRRAVSSKGINAMIIKPNQVGSLLEVKKVMEFCKKNKIASVFSHRSGETMDYTLADLVVGFQGNFIKSGIMGKGRLIKLRRVMEIEKSLR